MFLITYTNTFDIVKKAAYSENFMHVLCHVHEAYVHVQNLIGRCMNFLLPSFCQNFTMQHA